MISEIVHGSNKEILDLVSRVYDYQEIERETQKKRDGYGLKYA